ncbi:hypothetical protein BDR03DRAFT_946907 [Suillus americanus]|nr:hypothetical protein BDR03DRAFT_946907 [Suillus americanus]
MTLEKAVLDLHIDSFTHGQLYPTLSRVRCRRDIRTLFAGKDDGKRRVQTSLIVIHSKKVNGTLVRSMMHILDEVRYDQPRP